LLNLDPSFIVIGERRSGSTTIAKWMDAHPQIGVLPTMDTGYFIDDLVRGRKKWIDGFINHELWNNNHDKEGYLKLFLKREFPLSMHKVIGEKSADYFFLSETHLRIKEFFPEIKLIVVLRNPIKRAWSHYFNELGKGREWLDFESAILQEETRIKQSDYARTHLSYLSRGFYFRSLERLYKVFDPQNILVYFTT